MRTYLLNLTMSGIKNLKNEIRLDFYKRTVNKDFDPERYRVKAIYGENGAGKSGIITAVNILQNIALNKKYLSDSQNQKFLSEIINKSTYHFFISAELLVETKNEKKKIYRYQFSLSLGDDESYVIDYEALSVRSGSYSNSVWSDIYTTRAGMLEQCAANDEAKMIIDRYSMNLLQTSSLLSIFTTSNISSNITNESENTIKGYVDFMLHLFLAAASLCLLNVYMDEADQHKQYILKTLIQDLRIHGKDIPRNMTELSGEYEDISSKNVKKTAFENYEKTIKKLAQFIRIFKPDLLDIVIDRKDNGDEYVCELNMDYGDYKVNLEFESTGIKKLVRLFSCFRAASKGAIVFIDEMDSNINDVFLCKLIEYFVYYGKGQLCFTTHNLDPMSVLEDNSNAIDFLSSYGTLTPWVKHGHASPENTYKNGMIKDNPFNIDAADFLSIFEED